MLTLLLVSGFAFAQDPPTVESYRVQLPNAPDDMKGFPSGLEVQTNFIRPTDEEQLESIAKVLAAKPGPVDVVTSQDNGAWAQKLTKELQAEGVKPKDIHVTLTPSETPQTRKVWRFMDHYVPSTKQDLAVGTVMTVFKGVITFVGSYVIAHAPIARVIPYVAISSALTAAFSMQRDTINNLFRGSIWGRSFFDLGTAIVMRTINGPTARAHAVNTPAGALEISKRFAVLTVAGAAVADKSEKTFSEDLGFANRWYNFNAYFAFVPFDVLNMWGITMGTWFSVTLFHTAVKLETWDVMAIVANLAAIYALKKKPDLIIKVARVQEATLNRFFPNSKECDLNLRAQRAARLEKRDL